MLVRKSTSPESTAPRHGQRVGGRLCQIGEILTGEKKKKALTADEIMELHEAKVDRWFRERLTAVQYRHFHWCLEYDAGDARTYWKRVSDMVRGK
jgi:hypothetical protein